MTTTTTTKCLHCRAPRQPKQYLCGACWPQLPKPTRDALWRRDALAGQRLLELNLQITDQVPLSEITVTP
jgi:hypothetical protein